MKSIEAAVPSTPIVLLECDLAAARKFACEPERLDMLFRSARIMTVPPGQTSDGYEIQFGTNHVVHALLSFYYQHNQSP
jgi:retinol dehydrogenase 12